MSGVIAQIIALLDSLTLTLWLNVWRKGIIVVKVKRYNSDQKYQRDANRMQEDDWRVTNVISEQPRSGCMRFVLTGGLALFFKPKPVLVVTYEK